MLALAMMLAALNGVAGNDFMVRDDGVRVTCVHEWKPRMLEITSKFERQVFGEMAQLPQNLEMKCVRNEQNALGGKATLKEVEFTWPRTYDRGCFRARVYLPNSTTRGAALVYLREGALPDAPSEDWPFDEIVSRGYAAIGFDGSQLTASNAVDAVARRAWAFRMIYEWCCDEPRIDEMTVSPVGCGSLDGVAAFWASSYDWRFYCVYAAQTGLDRRFVELSANNAPGLLYTSSCKAQSAAEIANDKALAEEVAPVWRLYGGMRALGGYTGWHVRDGARGLNRDDWRKFLAFTDRHGWNIGDKQVPLPGVPALNATTREEWEKVTRPKYLKFFTENVYGVAPPKPADLTFVRTAPDKTMRLEGGTEVVRLMLAAKWTGKRGKGSFPFLAFIPRDSSKVPCSLYLSLGKQRMDPERKFRDGNWDVEQICARGYAAVGVYYEDISPDHPSDFNVPPFNSFELPSERTDKSWCTIAAWAWGLSRIMDWIETESRIDAKRVIVSGHSRGGKTALLAGALDERFAMTVPCGSGRGGMMLSHMKTPFPTETIALINSEPTHWFAPYFKRCANRDLELDFDQHQLAACVAPRLLLVDERTGDMSRYADWYAEVFSSPAWELYGYKGLKMGPMPKVGEKRWADRQAYLLTFGPHNVSPEDWRGILDFADARMPVAINPIRSNER